MSEARELVDGRDDALIVERAYEPDDDAITRAVAILLREEAAEGEAA